MQGERWYQKALGNIRENARNYFKLSVNAALLVACLNMYNNVRDLGKCFGDVKASVKDMKRYTERIDSSFRSLDNAEKNLEHCVRTVGEMKEIETPPANKK